MTMARRIVGALVADELKALDGSVLPDWVTEGLVKDWWSQLRASGDCTVTRPSAEEAVAGEPSGPVGVEVGAQELAAAAPAAPKGPGSQHASARAAERFASSHKARVKRRALKLKKCIKYQSHSMESLRKMATWRLWKDLPQSEKDKFLEDAADGPKRYRDESGKWQRIASASASSGAEQPEEEQSEKEMTPPKARAAPLLSKKELSAIGGAFIERVKELTADSRPNASVGQCYQAKLLASDVCRHAGIKPRRKLCGALW